MPSSGRVVVSCDVSSSLPAVGDIQVVADFLGCCRATVRREVKRNRLRGSKVGQRWRFRREDVLAYLNGLDPASIAEREAWDEHVQKLVAAAPPLRPDQIATLSALLDYQPTDTNGGAA